MNSLLDRFAGEEKHLLAAGRAALGWRGKKGDPGAVAETDGCLVVVDGCVFNEAEVRPAGTRPGGAALIAALYRRHGFAGALSRLSGDFSICLYDTRDDRLWLGRDRFGVKPLYYATHRGHFIAASQPRALLQAGVPDTLNEGFVARFAGSHYRTFDVFPAESPFAAIAQLPAAHVMAADAATEAYWKLEDAPDWTDSEELLAERYQSLLRAAVRRRLSAVSKPLFTLSGGLDSSSVLCCAAIEQNQRQRAISSTYADATYDERHEILDVVTEKVAHWEPVEISNDVDVEMLIQRMVEAHDEPVATATWLSHFLVADRATSLGADSLFGGLGGDELNAGEYEYFPMHFADLKAGGDSVGYDREVAAWARHHDHPIYHKNPRVAEDMLARMTDAGRPGRVRADRQRLLRYAGAVDRRFYDLSQFAPPMDGPFSSYLKNRTWQDLSRETLPCCLRAEDRQCAAFGITHFDPFLDHELVEFMYRVPGRLKIRDGTTKQLLRRAMSGILPEATRTRVKKTGWNAPAHRWFQGAHLERLRDRVASRGFRERGIYDPAEVRRLIDEHDSIVARGAAEENHMMFLWQLLNLDVWLNAISTVRGTSPTVTA